MRPALLILLASCSSPAPGSVPSDICRTVLGGQNECYSLAYTLDPASPATCPKIDQYLGPPGEVDYAFYRSPNGSCKTQWTASCSVMDDCTEKDGTREQASLAFNIGKSGMTGLVTATTPSMTCTYHAAAGPLHTCK